MACDSRLRTSTDMLVSPVISLLKYLWRNFNATATQIPSCQPQCEINDTSTELKFTIIIVYIINMDYQYIFRNVTIYFSWFYVTILRTEKAVQAINLSVKI